MTSSFVRGPVNGELIVYIPAKLLNRVLSSPYTICVTLRLYYLNLHPLLLPRYHAAEVLLISSTVIRRRLTTPPKPSKLWRKFADFTKIIGRNLILRVTPLPRRGFDWQPHLF